MYIRLRVKYLLFLPDFNETLILSTEFRKILKYRRTKKKKSVRLEASYSMRTEGYEEANSRFPPFFESAQILAEGGPYFYYERK